MPRTLDTRDYYRLPWTLNDNILGWLEPTKRCNIYCDGCYSRNDPKSDKTVQQVRSDLEVFTSKRKVDSISVAGGDPLIHPEIVEIIRMIKEDFGLKPVINTNGHALTPVLLRQLKAAGLFGFTFHVDSSQHRPGRKQAQSEMELSDLRLELARMVADVGGLSTAFNCTVFPHTLDEMPKLMAWASEHIDIVHSMVFILFRTMRRDEFDYFAGGKKVKMEEVVYWDQEKNPKPIMARELVDRFREHEPEYEPCAYLGGTVDPESFKWLVAGRLGDGEKVFGYVGPKYMEAVQTTHHAVAGKYLAYTDPKLLSGGKGMMAGFSTIDSGMRKVSRNYLKDRLRSPAKLMRPVHFQSIVIIQPLDFMADGQVNMCDGCPDMTVHEGELVWSCRLDERMEYGCFLSAAPKQQRAEKGSRGGQPNGKKKTPLVEA